MPAPVRAQARGLDRLIREVVRLAKAAECGVGIGQPEHAGHEHVHLTGLASGSDGSLEAVAGIFEAVEEVLGPAEQDERVEADRAAGIVESLQQRDRVLRNASARSMRPSEHSANESWQAAAAAIASSSCVRAVSSASPAQRSAASKSLAKRRFPASSSLSTACSPHPTEALSTSAASRRALAAS